MCLYVRGSGLLAELLTVENGGFLYLAGLRRISRIFVPAPLGCGGHGTLAVEGAAEPASYEAEYVLRSARGVGPRTRERSDMRSALRKGLRFPPWALPLTALVVHTRP